MNLSVLEEDSDVSSASNSTYSSASDKPDDTIKYGTTVLSEEVIARFPDATLRAAACTINKKFFLNTDTNHDVAHQHPQHHHHTHHHHKDDGFNSAVKTMLTVTAAELTKSKGERLHGTTGKAILDTGRNMKIIQDTLINRSNELLKAPVLTLEKKVDALHQRQRAVKLEEKAKSAANSSIGNSLAAKEGVSFLATLASPKPRSFVATLSGVSSPLKASLDRSKSSPHTPFDIRPNNQSPGNALSKSKGLPCAEYSSHIYFKQPLPNLSPMREAKQSGSANSERPSDSADEAVRRLAALEQSRLLQGRGTHALPKATASTASDKGNAGSGSMPVSSPKTGQSPARGPGLAMIPPKLPARLELTELLSPQRQQELNLTSPTRHVPVSTGAKSKRLNSPTRQGHTTPVSKQKIMSSPYGTLRSDFMNQDMILPSPIQMNPYHGDEHGNDFDHEYDHEYDHENQDFVPNTLFEETLLESNTAYDDIIAENTLSPPVQAPPSPQPKPKAGDSYSSLRQRMNQSIAERATDVVNRHDRSQPSKRQTVNTDSDDEDDHVIRSADMETSQPIKPSDILAIMLKEEQDKELNRLQLEDLAYRNMTNQILGKYEAERVEAQRHRLERVFKDDEDDNNVAWDAISEGDLSEVVITRKDFLEARKHGRVLRSVPPSFIRRRQKYEDAHNLLSMAHGMGATNGGPPANFQSGGSVYGGASVNGKHFAGMSGKSTRSQQNVDSPTPASGRPLSANDRTPRSCGSTVIPLNGPPSVFDTKGAVGLTYSPAAGPRVLSEAEKIRAMFVDSKNRSALVSSRVGKAQLTALMESLLEEIGHQHGNAPSSASADVLSRAASRQLGEEITLLFSGFRRLDVDGDGFLTVRDIAAFLDRYSISTNSETVPVTFNLKAKEKSPAILQSADTTVGTSNRMLQLLLEAADRRDPNSTDDAKVTTGASAPSEPQIPSTGHDEGIRQYRLPVGIDLATIQQWLWALDDNRKEFLNFMDVIKYYMRLKAELSANWINLENMMEVLTASLPQSTLEQLEDSSPGGSSKVAGGKVLQSKKRRPTSAPSNARRIPVVQMATPMTGPEITRGAEIKPKSHSRPKATASDDIPPLSPFIALLLEKMNLREPLIMFRLLLFAALLDMHGHAHLLSAFEHVVSLFGADEGSLKFQQIFLRSALNLEDSEAMHIVPFISAAKHWDTVNKKILSATQKGWIYTELTRQRMRKKHGHSASNEI